MDTAEQLEAWANEARAMLGRFHHSRDGIHIGDGDEARFTGLVLEAQDLLSDVFGAANSFGWQLERTRLEGISNLMGSQSYHSVEQAVGILSAAAKAARRKSANPSSPSASHPTYVDLSRLDELRSITSSDWDLRRLICMCEELNKAFSASSFHATAMLVRAITDHVPPIFGAASFAEYASSMVSKSHKSSMERLSRSLRDIADGALHVQIRKREALPASTQVDFRAELDVLLAEVARALR